MTVLDRYLTRQCVIAIATVIGVLAALTLLFALIEELDEGNANYGFSQALHYLLLTMPRRIEELLSYGVFIGLLLALGNLAEGGELTAIRAAGVSPRRIILGLLPTLGLCLALNLALSDFYHRQENVPANKASSRRFLVNPSATPLPHSSLPRMVFGCAVVWTPAANSHTSAALIGKGGWRTSTSIRSIRSINWW